MRSVQLASVFFVPVLILTALVVDSHAAQLRLRRDVLLQQSDRALIAVTGRIEHAEMVSDKGDCELRAAVHANELKVPLVAEFINACSVPLDPQEIKGLSQAGDVRLEGVFRIWFEHAGSIDQVLSEEMEWQDYEGPNPRHAVEIHPVIQAADRSFLPSIRAKEWFDFTTYSTPALMKLMKRKATIEEYEADDGLPYVLIESTGVHPTYFHLKGILRAKPVKTEDGYASVVDIVDKRRVVVAGVRIFSVQGTKANDALKILKPKSEFSFWGIARLDGKKILNILEDDSGYHVPVPFEFVLLDLHR